ncbi:1-acyl-sn-glycerol-3-phosphate acyltransferase [Patescibacteria group bacterium]|nr:1-acyl-sn-glycerol-3-phosphate acyltransferase [Patescibacteria group bacterium]
MAEENFNQFLTESEINRVSRWQKFFEPICRRIFQTLAGLQILIPPDVQNLNSPVLIVANHVSWLDPFLIGAALFGQVKIFPFFYITKDKLINFPLFGRFIKRLGAFAAHRGEGLEKSLALPRGLLNSGHSVVFFPQGRLYEKFEVEQGRPGAAALALATNKPILPVAILGLTKLSWLKFFLGKYEIKIVVGRPFSLKDKLLPDSQPNIELAAKIIMEEIKELLGVGVR